METGNKTSEKLSLAMCGKILCQKSPEKNKRWRLTRVQEQDFMPFDEVSQSLDFRARAKKLGTGQKVRERGKIFERSKEQTQICSHWRWSGSRK
jgi:hypothetical protein